MFLRLKTMPMQVSSCQGHKNLPLCASSRRRPGLNDDVTDKSGWSQQSSMYYILPQRGRAMLRVIEYFAKSPKVTQGH